MSDTTVDEREAVLATARRGKAVAPTLAATHRSVKDAALRAIAAALEAA